jgi:hypothetical protein
MKDYLKKKDGEKLSISLTEQKLSRSLTRAPLSYSPDGQLHYGYKVMLWNKKTDGFLVIDMGDRIQSFEEAYAVTTSTRCAGPINRSVFVVVRADSKEENDEGVVQYGEKVRILANRYISSKPVRVVVHDSLHFVAVL